jgi:uncharacterized protein (TIGR03118 family)
MHRSTLVTSALAAVLVATYLVTNPAAKQGGYAETDLVTNKSMLTDKNGIVHVAPVVDPNLLNPWGVAESSGSPFWISDNNAGVATLYNVPGSTPNTASINPLVVRIPTPVAPSGGAPTGTVFNTASPAFEISGVDKTGAPAKAPAVFLFATEDGTIVGWNPGVGLSSSDFNGPNGLSTQGVIAVDNSGNNFTNPDPSAQTGAVYKGLAIAPDANGVPHLYATNFRSGLVEIYNANFMGVTTFTDPKLPDSYAPFNIVPINGELFVAFAVQDAAKHDPVAGQGHGIVDMFTLDGQMHDRFAQHGQLNSPWGMALTPSNFGELGGTLWIGNFGDGRINAFELDSGKFVSKVRQSPGQEIVIDGLWTIRFGNGGNGGAMNTLYFTAGPNAEKDGLFGSLNPN